MKRFNKIFTILGLMTAMMVFSLATFGQTGTETMVIADKQVDCSMGAGRGKCMLVSKDDSKTWQYFYNQIEGFTFRDNYTQMIEVIVTKTANPVPGMSALKYKYVKTLRSKRTNGTSAKAAMASLSKGNSASGTSLTGTNWKLEQLNGKALINPGPTLMLDGARDQFSAKACNIMTGDYSIFTGNRIRFSPNAASTKACAENITKMENEYARALTSATNYEIHGSRLVLIDDGRTVASFVANTGTAEVRNDSTVENRKWLLSDIYGIQIKPGNSIPYIYLDSATKTVNGFGGCNNFSGKYTLDNGYLKFGPLAMTRKMCIDNHLNSVEQAMTKILAKDDKYMVSNGALYLTDNGQEEMKFVSATR